MNLRYILLSFLAVLSVSCSHVSDDLAVDGISLELAVNRKAAISEISYALAFDIPSDRSMEIKGNEMITFTLADKQDVILDFTSDRFSNVTVNGKPVDADFVNEHIVIPASAFSKGKNCVSMSFVSDDRSLNRNDEYLYSLFVPAHAHSAFPCFDQPDMKARFQLSLNIPGDWKAVSNAAKEADNPLQVADSVRTVHFSETKLLPTYLFSFVAGKWQTITETVDGKEMTAYYRETDPKKIAQFPQIFQELGTAISYLEDYTGIPMPFGKYDFVVVPGFQFGGMEHPGAVLYKESTIFLSENPTVNERENRIQLLAHETAHLWFGDMVTMRWFNDVWTKEVYANYFAAEMSEPMFPEINHELAWLQGYYVPSYADDRTSGSTPIRQDLGNLADAGLIYGNIIYDKAPIVMRSMVDYMGKDNFQEGIREYLREFAFDNATWDDLIEILDRHSDKDLKEFSRTWVYGKGIPMIEEGEPDSRTYGLFKMDEAKAEEYLSKLAGVDDPTMRETLLIQIYENYVEGYFSDSQIYIEALLAQLGRETNPQVASTIVGELPVILRDCLAAQKDGGSSIQKLESEIVAMSKKHPLTSVRQQLIRSLAANGVSEGTVSYLYGLWSSESNTLLSTNDYMTLSYQLAIRMPEKAHDILSRQRSRIDGSDKKRNFNPDLLRQFDFVSRAAVPEQDALDALFTDLLEPENRAVEPWAESALSLLNHFLREEASVKYVRPALDELLEVKATGDIFFPAAWCRALLSGHRSEAAYEALNGFLEQNPDYPQLLKNKILLNSYNLERANRSSAQ